MLAHRQARMLAHTQARAHTLMHGTHSQSRRNKSLSQLTMLDLETTWVQISQAAKLIVDFLQVTLVWQSSVPTVTAAIEAAVRSRGS